MRHYAILVDNQSQSGRFIEQFITNKPVTGFKALLGKVPALFSTAALEHYLYEETYHDIKILTAGKKQSLRLMSSGEQKKALLKHLLQTHPDFMILVNPYDNLDSESKEKLKHTLTKLSKKITLVQLVNRANDILPLTTTFFTLDKHCLKAFKSPGSFWKTHQTIPTCFDGKIPKPLSQKTIEINELVCFEKVSVNFDKKQILYKIDWVVKKGEFWQLKGPNGSGKSTLLKMITGDSHKGYGQNLTLFGQKKGSGESIWDIKQYIGYFTPSMIDDFRGYHSLEKMLISGFRDSIGLYTHATESEKVVAKKWLSLLGLLEKKELLFRQLTTGEKRLVMTARAMVKHPHLLILDEPTVGLDDKNVHLFVTLVNKIASETDTAIIFVSHRNEHGLKPRSIYQLKPSHNGSIGKIAQI